MKIPDGFAVINVNGVWVVGNNAEILIDVERPAEVIGQPICGWVSAERRLPKARSVFTFLAANADLQTAIDQAIEVNENRTVDFIVQY